MGNIFEGQEKARNHGLAFAKVATLRHTLTVIIDPGRQVGIRVRLFISTVMSG